MKTHRPASKVANASRQLTKNEYELFKSSNYKTSKNLTEFRIKQKINAVQKLINKYQKQASKKGLKTQGRALTTLTTAKERLPFLQEALAAFKAALKEKISIAKNKPRGKKATKLKATKKAARKLQAKVMGAIGELEPTEKNRRKIKPSNFKEKRLLRAGVLRKQGHAQARTQRKQGKRDSR